jgi:transposase
MKIKCGATKIWIASQPVDFRKAINGLSVLANAHSDAGMGDSLYVFYNKAKSKIKILGYHRNGYIMIYKQLDKKRFTLKDDDLPFYMLTEQHFEWLLAGLDWVDMAGLNVSLPTDFF